VYLGGTGGPFTNAAETLPSLSQCLDELASQLLSGRLQLPAEALPLGVFGRVVELLLEIHDLRFARGSETREVCVVPPKTGACVFLKAVSIWLV